MASRQVLLQSPAKKRRSVAEVAGGTAAECAAVVCCCPCAVVELLVMAVYKLPAGLCKRAWRKRLARNRKSLQLIQHAPPAGDWSHHAPAKSSLEASDLEMVTNDVAADEVEGDDDVWPRFYGTGFWRSPDLDTED